MQVVTMDVRVDQHGKIGRINATLEVLLVHLHQVVIALLRIASEVVPHQIIDHALCHALGAQEAGIEALVAPLDPARLRGHAIDQAQGAHLVRMGVSETGQNIRPGTNAETNHRL